MIPPDRIGQVTKWWEDLDPKQRQALLEHPAVKIRLGATFVLTERQREAELLLDGPATSVVTHCELPLSRDLADAISSLTGESIEIESYSDAGHAVRRWFAGMDEDGSRH